MTEYALRRDRGIISKKFSVCRQRNGRYFQLEQDDLDQGLVDYLVSQIRNGTLNPRTRLSFDIPDELADHYKPFIDTFFPTVSWHYDSVKDGHFRFELQDDRTVRVFSKGLGMEVRVGD